MQGSTFTGLLALMLSGWMSRWLSGVGPWV